MKRINKLAAALCLALIACLAVPALAPAGAGGAGVALAASKAKLNKVKATIYNGEKLQLKVSGVSGAATWASSDETVAKVSKKGVVTAKGAGKAVVTATVGKKKLNCALTVKPALTAGKASVSLKKGKTQKVTLTYKLSGKLKVKCDDASVIKCTLGKIKKGKCGLTFKGLRPGTATVTVTNSKSSDVAVIKVTVKGGGEASGPIVDKTEVTIGRGKSAVVNITWPYSDLPYLAWDDASVVTCVWGKWNGKGWPLTIKGLGKGTAAVTLAKSKGSAPLATVKVTVE